MRVVNVVDLMKLQPPSEHPHGLPDRDFDALFTTDKPIIFAFHGYPWLIHRLTYRRDDHDNIHVRGYKEEGTTTTPFDMCVMNDLDRFHLVGDVIDRVPGLGERAAYAKQALRDKLIDHRAIHPPLWRRHAGDQELDMGGRGSGARQVADRKLDGRRQRLREGCFRRLNRRSCACHRASGQGAEAKRTWRQLQILANFSQGAPDCGFERIPAA